MRGSIVHVKRGNKTKSQMFFEEWEVIYTT